LGLAEKLFGNERKGLNIPVGNPSKDLPKTPHRIKRKVDFCVENAIITLRDSFNWGTHRIKISLENHHHTSDSY